MEVENTENNNSIFIGKKPLRNYLSSINLQLKKEENPEIIIKARGKFISKAVDIAELAKRSNGFNLKTKEIKINTEEYQKDPESSGNQDKALIKVSTIEIRMSK